jgi:mannose-6-phosphate isomerase-like protein (cupin superfamily)
MDKSGKYWGITRQIFYHNNVEVHYLEINDGGYCSEHRHQHKFNKFIVLEGSLSVYSWKSGDDKDPDFVKLNPSDECTIKPGIFHKFENDSEKVTKAIEIYWTELSDCDIERRSIGGVNDDG